LALGSIALRLPKWLQYPLLPQLGKIEENTSRIAGALSTVDFNLKQMDFQMGTSTSATIYDTLVDVLTGSADRNAILAFRLNSTSQERLDLLLDKNRDGTLSEGETSELETYEQFEHVVRLLKARVLQTKPS